MIPSFARTSSQIEMCSQGADTAGRFDEDTELALLRLTRSLNLAGVTWAQAMRYATIEICGSGYEDLTK